MARRAREEASGKNREVRGRWQRAGEFSVVAKFCADFLLKSQLTPAVPPVLRRGRRDGPGGHVAQGRKEAPGEDREVPGRWRRTGEKAGRYQAAGGVWGMARRGAGDGASAWATALELRSVRA